MSTAVVGLLVFTTLLWSNAQAFSNNAADCCLSTSDTFIQRRIVKSYMVLKTDNGCTIPATVFITNKDRKLCAPPAEDQRYPWVMKLIVYLDKRSGKNKHEHGAQ